MKPRSLFSGARQALRLARECEREGFPSEADRHRDRAAYYLRSRRLILDTIAAFQQETIHVSSRTVRQDFRSDTSR